MPAEGRDGVAPSEGFTLLYDSAEASAVEEQVRPLFGEAARHEALRRQVDADHRSDRSDAGAGPSAGVIGMGQG